MRTAGVGSLTLLAMDPSSRRRRPATAVTALTTAGLLLAACGSDGSTAAGPAAAKENAIVGGLLADTSPPQLCDGCARIDPTTGALLLSDDAVVLGVFVQPGDTVQPGQLLATVLFDKIKAVIDLEGSDSFVVGAVPVVGATIMVGMPFIAAKR